METKTLSRTKTPHPPAESPTLQCPSPSVTSPCASPRTALKGKRAVIKSIQQRLHNRFNVSVAEVAHNEAWQLAGIDIAAVANTAAHASEVVANAVAHLEALRLDVEIIEEEAEVLD